MDKKILDEGKRFLVSYLKDKTVDYETYHPWRSNWEFVVLHSLRVEGYVKKILSIENHNLSQNDILITQLAAILHDLGRIHRREGHALLGRDIISDWLKDNHIIPLGVNESSRLLYLIEKHSDKEDGYEDYCLKVLRDADVLDEIGAMSIFMASNWIDRNNPYYFNLLSDRLENLEISYCEKALKLLNTEGARLILEEKKKFITCFVDQLKDELYGTEMFGQVSMENYFSDLL
ncbi:MAG: HD domain-containing protein [Tissierellales bacterium]